jgi:hypothetical protein
MVQSTSTTVDAFMAEVQSERQDAVAGAVRRPPARVGGTDAVGYDGPAGRDNLVSFNNQKGYIALYAGRAALDPHRASLKHASFGGGCVRFPKPDRIDWPTVETIVKDAFRAKG